MIGTAQTAEANPRPTAVGRALPQSQAQTGESDLRSCCSHRTVRESGTKPFRSRRERCHRPTRGRVEALIIRTAVRLGASRARRSGVDHSLGMGEAPGSNPGESTSSLTSFVQSWTRRSPTRSLRSLAGLPASPSERPSSAKDENGEPSVRFVRCRRFAPVARRILSLSLLAGFRAVRVYPSRWRR